MQSVLENFQKEAEELLKEIIPEALLYFKNDEIEYFKWLQKASLLKFHMPSIPNDQLHPKALARPLNQTFKDSFKK